MPHSSISTGVQKPRHIWIPANTSWVCVMLRLLKYYIGCMFLISNHDDDLIDAAIARRITMILSYPPLDADGRAEVWRNFVKLVPLTRGIWRRTTRRCPRGGRRISFALVVAAAAASFSGSPARSRFPRVSGRISRALVVAGSSPFPSW